MYLLMLRILLSAYSSELTAADFNASYGAHDPLWSVGSSFKFHSFTHVRDTRGWG